MKAHDVYSYGVISASTLYSLNGQFPSPEGYAELGQVRYMTGGEAANSSMVLARLGVSVRLDGNWLGDDENGNRTKALLSETGIDTSRLALKARYQSVQEVVFAANGTRTIFGTYGRLLEQAHWNMPTESDVTQAKVVCLDPFFAEPASKVAHTAAASRIPVVTVDCRHDNPLLQHAAAIVIAESFINENYPGQALEGLFNQYRSATDALVIFTFGDAPIWYANRGGDRQSVSAFPIEPIDTTGGGDAFRAGVVYGFLQGWQSERIIEFAAGAAALVCSRFPGVLHAPTLDEVLHFLQTDTRK